LDEKTALAVCRIQSQKGLSGRESAPELERKVMLGVRLGSHAAKSLCLSQGA